MISKVIDVPINIGWFGSKPSDQITLKVAKDYSDYRIVNVLPNSRNAFKQIIYYILGAFSFGFYYRTAGYLVILEYVEKNNNPITIVNPAQAQKSE